MKKRIFLSIWTSLFSLFLILGVGVKTQAKVIYTTDPQTDAVAEKIIQSCSDDSMTREEKLRAVYYYLVRNMRYSWSTGSTKIHVSKKEIKKSKKMARTLKVKRSREFRNRFKNVRTLQGTCYGQAKVFCILANHLGYTAHMCHGTHVTGGGSCRSSHYWCYVVIKGKKKYFDVQYANRCYHRNHNSTEVESCYMASRNNKYWREHYD
jgi:transglutaminase/protease-like cytokinesis protein 3